MNDLTRTIESLFEFVEKNNSAAVVAGCFAFGERVNFTKERDAINAIQRIIPVRNYYVVTNLIRFTETKHRREPISTDAYLEKQLVHLKLMTYLLIIETKYIYKVIMNCLRVVNGQEPDIFIFNDKSNSIPCWNSIHNKYGQMGATGGTVAPFAPLFDHIRKCAYGRRCETLRNAIAHNDYYVHEKNRQIIVPSQFYASGERRPIFFSFQEICEYYEGALQLAKAFHQAIQSVIGHFKNY